MVTPDRATIGPATDMRRAAPLLTRERNQMPSVLVIDDEANIRQFVAVNLKARGYVVSQVGSAEEGLQQMRDNAPDALILDIKLPGMSGWDMLKRVVADPRLPRIPVIILTSSLIIDHAGELGYPNIACKLIKPISTMDLVGAVRKVFG